MNKIAQQLKDMICRLADVKKVVKRIEKKVPYPAKKEEMIEKVETYNKTKDPRDDIDLRETHMIYPTDEMGDEFDIPNSKREVDINWTSHANYRSELRDINPDAVNVAIRNMVDVRPKFNRFEKVKLTRPFGTAVLSIDGRRPSDIEADVVTVY